MVQITKKSTQYDVQELTKSAIQVSGYLNVSDDGNCIDLRLSFMQGNETKGNVNYNEYGSNISYNYNYSDAALKAEIEQTTDEVIAEIKQQIAASK